MSMSMHARAVAHWFWPAVALAIALIAQPVSANERPTISGTPTKTATVGTTWTFTPKASDPDGKKVSFGIRNQPSWTTFSTSTGKLTGKPTKAATYSNIEIYAWDGVYAATLPAFSITVKSSGTTSTATSSSNDSRPTISGTPSTSATVGVAWSFTPKASDPDGTKPSFGIRNKPSWATFSSSTGKLSGTPTRTGTYSSVQIYAWDGKYAANLPAFTITVKSASGGTSSTNHAPTITGTPATSVTVGNSYSFKPTAKDADGNSLGYSIKNKPSWATFSTATGQLSGKPSSSNVGSFSNIVISVSDGKASASLKAFTIAVKAASSSGTGSATLSWTPPTTNTDGSSLTNLSGYRIYYGTSSSSLNKTVQITNPSISTYVIDDLSAATWYFAVKAVASSGAESALSNKVSKTIK
ncbi:MAG TPA: putative Ig domain-containing protein [Povalibacter sp.]|nr:putative Ig domain-containing protein [Povalibacter sp.]